MNEPEIYSESPLKPLYKATVALQKAAEYFMAFILPNFLLSNPDWVEDLRRLPINTEVPPDLAIHLPEDFREYAMVPYIVPCCVLADTERNPVIICQMVFRPQQYAYGSEWWWNWKRIS